MKTAAIYLAEANEAVPRISAEAAIEKHKQAGSVFIDVRDSGEIAKSGTVEGALRISRGMIEFIADDATPHHNAALTKDADIYLICAAGGQAALTGKTMVDMGYKNITNVGGFSDWKAAGGPTED
ncbi:MAG: rhodanese-like domain-containing protein [Rhizobiales bacterium]|nr:rhodanese-like domain-containing protein [Hyphomicrobiales bacterium]NRB13226.1 rhodanese-like domain-containing protein [Hyphomicrobiales bacterium]